MMEYIMFGLLSFSLLLMIVSLFMKDRYKEIKSELEQLSMQQIQETYQIKRKLKVLEEELLVNDGDFPQPLPTYASGSSKKEIHAIIKNQVWSLAQQGLSLDQIAKQSSLSIEDVQRIINELSVRGD
ncbi:hypothetical protein ACFYKX_17845 [Cytobacillus sp. FJAT-54145]|uniref:DUF2802 domain-containing protein n=1 Tax=Cytobacillus spartinae TaxID=3299023 RepID=A0ABW6KDX7_9BACI